MVGAPFASWYVEHVDYSQRWLGSGTSFLFQSIGLSIVGAFAGLFLVRVKKGFDRWAAVDFFLPVGLGAVFGFVGAALMAAWTFLVLLVHDAGLAR
jgi:hypothetical protein